MHDFIDWTKLERNIPLDELPSFHRSFLQLTRPDEEDWQNAFLRQIQGKVQATLKKLEREGNAKVEEGSIFIRKDLIPEVFQKYAD